MAGDSSPEVLKRSLVTGTVEGATAGGLKWVGNKFTQSKKVGAKSKPGTVEETRPAADTGAAAKAGVFEEQKSATKPALATGEEVRSATKVPGIIEEVNPIIKPIHGEPRNIRVHAGKQGKHILGHNNYEVAISRGKTPSVFNGTVEDAQRLVDEFAGTGQLLPNGYKERINFKKIIGDFVEKETGKSYPTTCGTVSYSKDGVHIVPSNPVSY